MNARDDDSSLHSRDNLFMTIPLYLYISARKITETRTPRSICFSFMNPPSRLSAIENSKSAGAYPCNNLSLSLSLREFHLLHNTRDSSVPIPT